MTYCHIAGAALIATALAASPAGASSLQVEPPSTASAAPGMDRDAAEEVEIVVQGLNNPFKLKSKQLINAQKMFAKKRAQLAPASTLYFRVRPKDGSSTEGLELYLKNGDEYIDLPLDARGRFTIPALRGKGWSLYANRADQALRVHPEVLTPGTTEFDRRLGDLRLECNVLVSFITPEMPLLTRLAAGALYQGAGGCDGGKFAYGVPTPSRPVASGVVVSGGERRSVSVDKSGGYLAPFSGKNKKLPHSARVKLKPR